MRFALALLSSFLLLHAQTYAISGGPVTSDTTSTTGTYSGLLIPSNNTSDLGGSGGDLGTGTTNEPVANSLGLFSLGVPDTGLGTGSFIMFSEGRVFTGTINAFGDPGSGEINGILEATYSYTLHTPTVTTTVTNGVTSTTTTFTDLAVTAGVHGNMKAETEADSDIFSATGIRIEGKATLNIDQGEVNNDGSPVITETLEFEVDGIQQTTAVVATTAATSTTGG